MKLASLTILLAAAAVAQDRPADPRGWNSTTWGMSPAAVQTAIAGARPERPELDNGLRLLLTTPAQVATFDARAEFAFDQKDALAAVVITIDDRHPRPSTFARLRDLLVEKYGRPTSAEEVPVRTPSGAAGNSRTVQWNLKYTVIRLTWYELAPFGYVGLRYSERTPDPTL